MINKMTIAQVVSASRKMREDHPGTRPQIVARANGKNSTVLMLVPLKEWTTLDGQQTSTIFWEHGQIIAQTWHAQRHAERQQLRRIADACRALLRDDERDLLMELVADFEKDDERDA